MLDQINLTTMRYIRLRRDFADRFNREAVKEVVFVEFTPQRNSQMLLGGLVAVCHDGRRIQAPMILDFFDIRSGALKLFQIYDALEAAINKSIDILVDLIDEDPFVTYVKKVRNEAGIS